MAFAQLCTVQDRIKVADPLPFDIRNADHTLLLARGQIITSLAQMQALLERGALVDAAEVLCSGEESCALPEQLPALWMQCETRVGQTLRADAHLEFVVALDVAARPVLDLIRRDPDLAIFQVVRQGAIGRTHYGVTHSLHSAIACFLVAQRLGWSMDEGRRAFNAALTMNLSVVELQGRLACQVTPLTEMQREQIREHPLRTSEKLSSFGVTDPDWLRAVAEHHEVEGGGGYPAGAARTCELASLVRRADIYTAKLSARISRPALAPNEAGRALFMQDGGHPMTAALVKEFGIYPPGCFVKLVSGEAGIVIKRGPRANAPLVASLTNRHGEPMIEPLRRDTADPAHAIAEVVSESSIRVRHAPEKLVRLASA